MTQSLEFLFSCVSSTILHCARQQLLMLRQDLLSGLSDRRGNIISLDLFNFGFCSRMSNILNRMWGGTVVKLHRRCYNALLPSIILANVQGIHNKINEIVNRIDTFCNYRDCNISWLAPVYPDSALQPPGYTVYWHDRNLYIAGMSRGSGGVCFLINKNWCTDVCIILQGSTSNLELITIKRRPSYLPCDFMSVTPTAVYIHPCAATNAAVRDLHVL